MRCNEVIRKLSEPCDAHDEPALAQHLAECKRCAEWAERSAQLDRLWDATRPADPAPETWDRVWSRVETELDKPRPTASQNGWTARPIGSTLEDVPRTTSRPARPWLRPLVVGSVGLAQAAAILVAVSLSWSGPSALSTHHARPNFSSMVDVPDGQVVYIRSTGPDVEVIDVTAIEASNGEDPWFNFLNRAEGESGSAVIAMSE